MIFFSVFSLLLGLQPLHEAGYKGQGITIAVIDCGFYGAKNADIFNQNHIIGAYDLLKQDSLNRESMFDNPFDSHGALCLSFMLAQNDEYTGTAPDADYILIRTEDLRYEYEGEVERLERGLALAEEKGADIVTISLGYNIFDNPQENYTYEQMNGQSSVSRKATELMHKGILVCVAAGNQGDKDWRYIDIPADAEDILTVGAVNGDSIRAPFSGIGPSADGRIKPDVAAWGQSTPMISLNDGSLSSGSGTSFATPEIAGMAACIWQALPHLTALQLREVILMSSTQYDAPDCKLGYGIPNAATAWEKGKQLPTDYDNNALIDTQNQSDDNTRKIFYRGQLYIIRNGVWYSPIGMKKG